jgi:hypothetical protein
MTEALISRMRTHFTEKAPENYESVVQDLRDSILVLAQQSDNGMEKLHAENNLDEYVAAVVAHSVWTLFMPENEYSHDGTSPDVVTSEAKQH